jgi:diaminopimelate epimerase
MSIEFWKYEGLGNDFIVVDTRRWPAETRAAIDGATARRLCDRHFGIGADGVLRLDPPNHPEDALAAMVVLNADGSTAEMCGNGLRCVARFLGDRGEVPTDGRLTIDTGAGPLPCRLGHDTVSVSLGAVTDDGRVTLELDGEAITGRVLHLGNPHLVLEPAGDRTAAGRFGAAAQAHPRFSGGVNVSSRRFTDRPRGRPLGLGARVRTDTGLRHRGRGDGGRGLARRHRADGRTPSRSRCPGGG